MVLVITVMVNPLPKASPSNQPTRHNTFPGAGRVGGDLSSPSFWPRAWPREVKKTVKWVLVAETRAGTPALALPVPRGHQVFSVHTESVTCRSPCDLIPATSLPDSPQVIPLGPSLQALCTCGSPCPLCPGTPPFENCIALSSLSFRLDAHLLRVFPTPSAKQLPRLPVYFFLHRFISN